MSGREDAARVDAAVADIAAHYLDEATARFAINDFRDWLNARTVVADTTAGEAECGCGGTGIRKFDSDGYEACPVHLRRALADPDDTQQDGAR